MPFRPLIRSWPRWVAYAAAVWSLAYGLLGVYWYAGGAGFPFAAVPEDRRSGSILEGTEAHTVAPVIAALGLLGAVLGVLMARTSHHGRATTALLIFGWAMAVTLSVIIPDYIVLGLIAFAPALLVFAFTGVPGPQDGLGDILYWHRTNLLILFAAGLLWAAATVAYQRRIHQACPYCGRRPGRADQSRAALLRRGRRAVLIACLAPVPYEITRIAWFLGVPLGVPRDFLRMMQDTPGMLEVGLGCSVASILGAVLTHGLTHRWGEVCPRWIWFRAGRPVPPALAVVPASIVAVGLIPAGLMNIRMDTSRSGWALTVPGMLWVVWGAALGAATVFYHLRRRGACPHCELGDTKAKEIREPALAHDHEQAGKTYEEMGAGGTVPVPVWMRSERRAVPTGSAETTRKAARS